MLTKRDRDNLLRLEKLNDQTGRIPYDDIGWLINKVRVLERDLRVLHADYTILREKLRSQ